MEAREWLNMVKDGGTAEEHIASALMAIAEVLVAREERREADLDQRMQMVKERIAARYGAGVPWEEIGRQMAAAADRAEAALEADPSGNTVILDD